MYFATVGARERKAISRVRDWDADGLGKVLLNGRLCLIQMSDAGR